MSLKRAGSDGAWQEIENVRRYDGAAWQDVEFVRRWNGTSWVDCWIGNRFVLGPTDKMGAKCRVQRVDDYVELFVQKDDSIGDYYQAGIMTEKKMNLSAPQTLEIEWLKSKPAGTSTHTVVTANQGETQIVLLDNSDQPPNTRTVSAFTLPANTTRVDIMQRIQGNSGLSGASVRLVIYKITIGGKDIPIEL